MFRSLHARLLISYIAVVLVCLALVGLGLLLFVRTSPLWTNAAFLRLEIAARETLADLREAGSLQSPLGGQFHKVLAQAAEENEVRVLVLDAKGTVRFDSGGDWEGELLEEPARVQILRGRARGTFNAPSGGRWAFVGQTMPALGGNSQTLLFVSPQGRLLMLVWFAENLLPPLARAGAVALVLSVLMALLISRSVVAPLRRVADAAESIARGETDTRAPVSGPTEVRGLACSFNTMAEQVEAAQQSQRDFVANVSHELKTPLTSIQGFSQALLDGTASAPETTARAARVIHEEAERMRRMVDELLILARFDAGQVVMARDPVEIGPLLRGCVEKLAPQMEAADVDLEMDVSEQLFVTGDADRLAQVFANLLGNATAHMPAGGKVTVTAHPVNADIADIDHASVRASVPDRADVDRASVPDHPRSTSAAFVRASEARTVEVTVTDTGEGIPAEDLPRIFERFYQVDKARTHDQCPHRHSRGAGLGLAITKEIVWAHGGRITAESVRGLGSKFTVRLPAREGSTVTTVVKRRKIDP